LARQHVLASESGVGAPLFQLALRLPRVWARSARARARAARSSTRPPRSAAYDEAPTACTVTGVSKDD
jgi:hypothetical protein